MHKEGSNVTWRQWVLWEARASFGIVLGYARRKNIVIVDVKDFRYRS